MSFFLSVIANPILWLQQILLAIVFAKDGFRGFFYRGGQVVSVLEITGAILVILPIVRIFFPVLPYIPILVPFAALLLVIITIYFLIKKRPSSILLLLVTILVFLGRLFLSPL